MATDKTSLEKLSEDDFSEMLSAACIPSKKQIQTVLILIPDSVPAGQEENYAETLIKNLCSPKASSLKPKD